MLRGLESFVTWLCEREHADVGSPHRCFDCPLARYLSETTGRLWGVDAPYYGPASMETYRWAVLPLWARLFVSSTDTAQFPSLTGAQALDALASIELRLTSSSCSLAA